MAIRKLVAGLLIVFLFSGVVHGSDFITKVGEKFFQRYVSLSERFDPALAELYAADVFIQNTRRYPEGRTQVLVVPASQFKQLLLASLPLAQIRGDVSTFRDITYTAEGDGIRISAIRYSKLKDYDSPFSLLIRPNENGQWLIYEELSESRP